MLLNIGETKWNFVINEVTLKLGGSLYVESLEFDFKSNTCNIIFTKTVD